MRGQSVGTADRVAAALALKGGTFRVPLVVLFQAGLGVAAEIAVGAAESLFRWLLLESRKEM